MVDLFLFKFVCLMDININMLTVRLIGVNKDGFVFSKLDIRCGLGFLNSLIIFENKIKV